MQYARTRIRASICMEQNQNNRKKYIQLSAGYRKKSCSQKNRSNLIVYSDRNGNQAYEDAYFQRKRGKQEIGVPYYIIDEETGTTVLSVPIKTL